MTTSNVSKPTFQEIILRLQQYWRTKAAPCSSRKYDMKSAPAPATPPPSCAPSAPSRGRPPTCSRRAARRTAATAKTRTGMQHYYQFQVVVLKPAPDNIPRALPRFAEALGFDLKKNDVRFVEDDWENPTLGAWGWAGKSG